MKSNSFLRLDLFVAVVVTILVYLLSLTDFFNTLEWKTYDSMFQLKRNIKVSDEVVLLNIDDEAIKTVGRWQWPRSKMGELLQEIKEFQPKQVIFDVEFVEKQEPSLNSTVYSELQTEADTLIKDSGKNNNLKSFIEKIPNIYIENDELLYNGLKSYGNAYLTVRGSEFEIKPEIIIESLKALSTLDVYSWKAFINHYSYFVSLLVNSEISKLQTEFIGTFKASHNQKKNLYELLMIAGKSGIADKEQLLESKMVDILKLEVETHKKTKEPLTDEMLQVILGSITAKTDYNSVVQNTPEVMKVISSVKYNYILAFSTKLTETSGLWTASDDTYQSKIDKISKTNKDKWKTAKIDELEKLLESAYLKIGNESETNILLTKMNDIKNSLDIQKLVDEIKLNKEAIIYAVEKEKYVPNSDIIDYVNQTSGFDISSINSKEELMIHPLELDVVVDPIYKGGKGFGFTNAEKESDGSLRSLAIFRIYDTPDVPSTKMLLPQLAFKPLMDYFQIKKDNIVIQPGEYILLKDIKSPTQNSVKDIKIPVDNECRMYINWIPAKWSNIFTHVSVGEIFKYVNFKKEVENAINQTNMQIEALKQQKISPSNENSPDVSQIEAQIQSMKESIKTLKDNLENIANSLLKRLKGKICFLGLTATATSDIGSIPVDAQSPMVAAHANFWNTIVQEDFFSIASKLEMFLITLLICLLICVISTRLKIFGVIISGVLGVLMYFGISLFMFSEGGKFYFLLFPEVSIILTFVGITLIKYLASDKEKQFIKGAFGQYLSPTVISQLLDDPSKLKLGGERREMTAFFSDVAGFSTISEKLTPEELVMFLNEYLTEMCDIIAKYNGTVDKFEGDAIIAFWGAPLDQADHAQLACYTTIEMQNRMNELRATWQQMGRPPLHMRVGLNSGPMVVGNMGSKTRMDYTMMGDNVNLAARLEGANKFYATYSMISESTYALAKDHIEVRVLDKIRVVGKKLPVTVYELMARKGNLSNENVQLLRHYNLGYEAYVARKWAEAIKNFEEVLKIVPKDGPSLTYIDRCNTFIKEPPVDDWDGVFTLTSKG